MWPTKSISYLAKKLFGWTWVENDREPGDPFHYYWEDSKGQPQAPWDVLNVRDMKLVKAMHKRGWNLTVTWDSNEWPIVEWQNESSKFTVCLEDFARCIYACTIKALRSTKAFS